MPLVSQNIPSLVGGISQQPPVFRRENQCVDSLNAYSDPVSGVKKRVGTERIRKVIIPENPKYFAIDRDGEEKYVAAVAPGGIELYDTYGQSFIGYGADDHPYLAGATDYKVLSIADTTFIVNPSKTVAMKADLTPTSTNTGIIFIRAAAHNNVYTVTLQGTGISITSQFTTASSGALSTVNVASSLAGALDLAPGVTATSVGSVIKYTTTATVNVKGFTSLGDAYMGVFPGSAQNFNELPQVGFPDVILRIQGDITDSRDDYFVRFEAAAPGNGIWRECPAPGIKYQLDPATMPHVLTRDEFGDFNFDEFSWAERITGDEESNPDPSFVGHRINNIVFHRDRLGFLSDVNVVMSQANGLNDFFRSTVATIVDSDPIDIAVSGTTVDVLRTVVPVKDGLLLFSENGQFLMSAGDADILSPETASIVNISNYKADVTVEPQRIGDQIYFLTDRGQYSGMREYLYESTRDFTQTSSITNHVPNFLRDIKEITGSSTENILVLTSSRLLYVYQYLYNGEEKIVSSWAKWDFNNSIIHFSHVFGNILYLLIERDGEIFMERMPINNAYTHPGLLGELCLDEYTAVKDSPATVYDYDGGTDKTTITIDTILHGEPVLISGVDNPSAQKFVGDRVYPDSFAQIGEDYQVVLDGDWTNEQLFIGTTYDFQYTFSTPYIRLEGGDLEFGGRLQLRYYTIKLSSTGDCQFRVFYRTPTESSSNFVESITDWSDILDMYTLNTGEADNASSEVYPLSRMFPELDLENKYNLIDANYQVPIMAENTQMELRVESDGWQPVTLNKAQWEGLFHKRNRLL